jgi:hypothetical protein
MYKFEVLEVNDERWSEIISKANVYDFHHTQCFHKIEKNNDTALLCVLFFDEDFIAFPILVREIHNTDYFDCTSVYGYGGPISSCSFDVISDQQISYFQNKMITFFKKSRIISVFSRLHPLIQSEKIFSGFGNIIKLNKIVAIDLSLSLPDQRVQYRKSNKHGVNKLRRIGFSVVEAEGDIEIDAFLQIYKETMERVNASDNYFFNKKYFYNFLKNNCFKNKLLLVKKEGEIVAGGIFTFTNNIMQYHLSGTKQKYLREAPMQLLLDEARLIGTELGFNFFNLGGGLGGSDNDSLFDFKAGFSKLRFQYCVWQFISDKKKYDELVIENNSSGDNSFFPQYRS